MAAFRIIGGNPLEGEVEISGSKNSAASIISATILTKEDCTIENLPRIDDVFVMLQILEEMGAKVEWIFKNTVVINTSDLNPEKLNLKLVEKIRMSIVLTGALLARFGEVKFILPGGDKIGSRPIETHLRGLASLGAKEELDGDKIVMKAPEGLKGNRIILGEMSVTATENIMLAAARAEGKTEIKIASIEPHVVELSKILVKMGVAVKLGQNHDYTIKGDLSCKGFKCKLIPDPIEIGTFLIGAAITDGVVKLLNVDLSHLNLELFKLKQAGVLYEVSRDYIKLGKARNLRSVGKIQSLPYPGFSTDLLPLFTLLMTQAQGTTLIHETMYEGRLQNYVPELQKMGANVLISDPHRAVVTGKTELYGKSMMSFDIRAGATLILAALVAKGESIIENIEQVDRGYEGIDEKLKKLGAKIERIGNKS